MPTLNASIVFSFFLFSCGIWAIRLGVLSLPPLALIALGVPYVRLFSKHLYWYLGMLLAGFFVLFSDSTDGHLGFYYSKVFRIIPLIMFFSWLNLSRLVKSSLLSRDIIHRTCWIASILAILLVAILSPSALYSPVDGQVGLFNEKGILGQYLSIVGILLVASKSSPLCIAWSLLLFFYSVIILESGRAVVFAIAVLFVFLARYYVIRFTSILSLSALSACFSPLFIPFFNVQLNKIGLILFSDTSLVGRYAAAYLVRTSSLQEFLIGHGYGSYLASRAMLLPLYGMDYDHAGSFLLEMVFEIGVPLTLLLIMACSLAMFSRASLPLLASTVLLFLFGVKSDAMMYFAMLSAQVFFVLVAPSDTSAIHGRISPP